MKRTSAVLIGLLAAGLLGHPAVADTDLAGVGSLATSAVIEERDGLDTVVRQIVYGADEPLWQVLTESSAQYIHVDARGSVVALTEGAGTRGASPGDLLELVTYDAFGNPRFQDANSVDKVEPGAGTYLAQSDYDNDLLFRGMVYDPETGNRGTAPGNDFGGLYVRAGAYLDADDGRTVRRNGEGVASDPGFGILKGGLHDAPYGSAGHAPVNLTGAGRGAPQTREHVLLARQVGVPATPRGMLLPAIQNAREAGKTRISGYRTVSDITLKRGVVGGESGFPLGWVQDEPQPLCCKEKFERTKPHINVGTMGGAASIPGIEHEDIGAPAAPASIPGIEHEDIGVPATPATIPGIEHEDIGAPATAAMIPGIEHEDIGAPAASATIPGIEHEDIGFVALPSGTGVGCGSGHYCMDPPWGPPMCCGFSDSCEPGGKTVEVCVYF